MCAIASVAPRRTADPAAATLNAPRPDNHLSREDDPLPGGGATTKTAFCPQVVRSPATPDNPAISTNSVSMGIHRPEVAKPAVPTTPAAATANHTRVRPAPVGEVGQCAVTLRMRRSFRRNGKRSSRTCSCIDTRNRARRCTPSLSCCTNSRCATREEEDLGRRPAWSANNWSYRCWNTRRCCRGNRDRDSSQTGCSKSCRPQRRQRGVRQQRRPRRARKHHQRIGG